MSKKIEKQIILEIAWELSLLIIKKLGLEGIFRYRNEGVKGGSGCTKLIVLFFLKSYGNFSN